MKWLQFILSHSIFIAICAVALCYQTFVLLHISNNIYLYGLIFFSTLCSYNFYWLISKYYFSERKYLLTFLRKHYTNTGLCGLAAIGLLYCICFLPGIIPFTLIAVGLTLLYSVPLWPVKELAFTRRAGFLKTVVLALTWTFVTVMLPAHLSLSVQKMPVALLFSARFLFMLMLCAIFDSRDIHVDKIHALSSLATDVSRNMLQLIMGVVFVLYIICGMVLRYYFDDSRQVIAFIITGMATLFVYILSLKKRGYFFYYFLVDGLMLLSAFATYVASI